MNIKLGPNKTNADNGSYGICRVINVLRSPSPDPKRCPLAIAIHHNDERFAILCIQ